MVENLAETPVGLFVLLGVIMLVFRGSIARSHAAWAKWAWHWHNTDGLERFTKVMIALGGLVLIGIGLVAAVTTPS